MPPSSQHGQRPGRAPRAPRALRITAAALLLPMLLAADARSASAQDAWPADPLAPFVAEAIRANLALSERGDAVRQREAASREARGRYLPSVAIDARHTRAYGAVLDFGEVLNPVYGALNQLLGAPTFPSDLNLQLPLRQETRLRLLQPLYQPAIGAGVAAARALHGAESAGHVVQARALAAQVRLAYLDVARATRVIELYDTTLPLVQENERVARRLIEAGRATPDVALRALAEHQSIAQDRLEAVERREAARRAFNVLLARPLESPLELVPDSLLAALPMPMRDAAVQGALARREELAQLARERDAARAQERLARASFLPAVTVALDYGVQGAGYRIAADRDFLLATVALQWNVFNGGQDAARREQAVLGSRRVETQRRDAEQRIAFEVTQAWTGASVAREAIVVAEARLAAAERAFRLVERRYAEGAASLVEFTDARAAYTSAGLNRILTTYDWLARRVDLDRAAALSPLHSATIR